MRRKILLSSLSVGRCFTIAVEPGGRTEESPIGGTRSDPVLKPVDAWKITDEENGNTKAENATGESKTFAGDSKVVEIPRQGYDRLAAQTG